MAIIGFVHYNWKNDGVTRVVLNNIKGLSNYGYSSKLIGRKFGDIPNNIDTEQVPLECLIEKEVVSRLELATRNCDYVVIENPAVGSRPHATLGFKSFSEKL